MTSLALAVTYTALNTLALAMKPHHRAVFTRELSLARQRWLRLLGWSLLTFSFATDVAVQGWQLGPVHWLAAIAIGGFALTLLLAYAPRWCALPIAALLLLAVL